MKTSRTILISFFVGILVCAIGGYFLFYAPRISSLESQNHEYQAINKNMGMQLGKEVASNKELRALLSEEQKKVIDRDEKIKYLNKTIFSLNNIIAQGHATPIPSNEKDTYTYAIDDQYFTGTITIKSTVTPSGVDYVIKLKNIDFEVTWVITKVKDGYKILVNTNDPNIIIRNNEFNYLTEKKKWYQEIHGEVLI